jgi:sugar lactone lactonase YvrE
MARRWIRPRRWSPPALTAGAPAARLRVLYTLPTGGHGPEDVVFDADGRVIAGLADGRIVRIDPADGDLTVLAETGGRPLGLHPRADGGVLVCDHDRGLLAVGADGTVEVLVDSVDGQPLTFASNVVEGPDGTIWFTTSSSRWNLDDHLGDVFEHSCTGRLLRRDPDGTVEVVLDGLAFANGVALAGDESFVTVAESGRRTVVRHWLAGDRAGTTDLLVDDLPGYPDNTARGSDGLVWVTVASPVLPLVGLLHRGPRWLRVAATSVPERVQPQPRRAVHVQAYDAGGTLVHDVRRPATDFHMVTGVREHEGRLWLGSLLESAIAVTHL